VYKIKITYLNYLKKYSLLILFSYAFLMISLAVMGGIINYSSIPHWDMWDGTLNFFARVQSGDGSAWWYQHNEHRIVLARVLFYVDNYFFHGKSASLVIENYLLVIISGYFFWLYLISNSLRKFSYSNIFAILVICPWLFFWSQDNNLTWGFQVQFFLAQLLPLIALYFLAKSIDSWKFYWTACFVGILSAGTMANGLMILPLMAIYYGIYKRLIIKTFILIIISAIVFYIYFKGYHSPDGHGKLLDSLINNPINYMWYFLYYIGSPFYYIFQTTNIGKFVAALAGGIILFSTISISLYQLKFSNKRDPFSSALLFYIYFIFITALLTAGGRLIFGVDQALSSRYTTPAMMAYCALFIIFVLKYKKGDNFYINKYIFVVYIIISLLMLFFQFKALKPSRDILSVREVAALSLALGISDDDYIGNVYPYKIQAINIAELAVKKDYSIFGLSPYIEVKNKIGLIEPHSHLKKCVGDLDKVELISGENKFVRLNGWISSPENSKYPLLVKISDSKGQTVGFSLTGSRRPDIAEQHGAKYTFSGFRGYLLIGATGKPLHASIANDCEIDIQTLPIIINTIKVNDLGDIKNESLITRKDVAFNEGWGGSDFNSSSIKNFKVLGTYLHSDADVGRIVIHGKKGYKFLYKSGPASGSQTLRIVGTDLTATLPSSLEWSWIQIAGPNVPEKFDFSITDSGKSWGEWSAIALWDK
jgi:hypothetical protein